MKKLLLSVLTLLAFAGSGTAQNLPSYVPANGLVGWWPFNGNANDESGNNNNGTVNGATLTADRFGNSNSAYNFNGTDNNITIVDNASLDLTNFSTCAWVMLPTYNSLGDEILTKGGDLFENYEILIYGSLNDAGTVETAINWTDGTRSGINSASGNKIISLNTWALVTSTYDVSNGKLRMYIDGLLVTENTPNKTPQINNSNLYIGQDPSAGRFHLGKIDDIAIYNRALTQQEITALYQGANTTANCLDMPSNLQQGLVGYWPFCGNALDESGNGNHGTVNGATLTNDRFGNAGSAYGFDGVDDKIEVITNSSINSLRNVSLGLWVKINSFPNSSVNGGISGLVTKWFGSGECNSNTDHFGTWISNDSIIYGGTKLYPFISSMTNSTEKIDPNTWQHLIFTHDSLTGGKLFLNKTLLSEIAITGGLCSTINSLFFGCDNGLGTNNRFLNGSLDDIAIWNRALSQNEITQLYNQGICQTSITVTDTLLIHTGITSYNPVAYQNTLKVWPNPGNQDITLDAGNLSSMQGWKYKVANGLGQIVKPETTINQQQTLIDLSTWGGNGIYYLHLINPQGIAVEIKKIVLAP